MSPDGPVGVGPCPRRGRVTDRLAACDMELEIFGKPSDDLAEVLVGFGARIYAPLTR